MQYFQIALDFSCPIVLATYLVVALVKANRKHSVTDSDRLNTEYFNIMWSKKHKDLDYL